MSEKRKPIYIIEFENGFILPVKVIDGMQGAMIPEEMLLSFPEDKRDEAKLFEAVVFKYKGKYPLEEYNRESGNEEE